MKTFRYIILVFLSLASVSCRVDDLVEESGSIQTFYATGEISTRTQLNEPDDHWWLSGKRVLWNPSDEINIFCQNGGGRFVSTNTENTNETVEFVGVLENVKDRKTRDPYWAVYPYSEDNTFDGQSVELSLPYEQHARQDNVERGLLISLARSHDKNLYFFNLCGVISIPVYEKGIKKIVFKGNDGEKLAGRIKASFDESGHPYISEWKDPVSEVTLLAPEGGVFDYDQMYDVVCFPGCFEKGYTIEFYREELVSIKQIHSPVTLSRAGFVNLNELYTGGTIYSVEQNGKEYALHYKQEGDSTRYWITMGEKTIEIPEHFNVQTFENPTRMGPAIAINTDDETVYFAMSTIGDKYYDDGNLACSSLGVIYRLTKSGYEKEDAYVGLYPFFRMNEKRNSLELHSYTYYYFLHEFDHFLSEKTSFNHWIDGEYDDYTVDYESSGNNKKVLSDIILLYQEDITNYPPSMTAIDLGLSVKWSSCNLGATAPERYGDRFAWGELTTKESFTPDNYRFGGAFNSDYIFTGCSKYNSEDEKYLLDSEDDAAHVILGEEWRSPSPEEWQELMDNCDWKWTSMHDVVGVLGTSKINGNRIFFPVDLSLDENGWEYGLYHSSQLSLGNYGESLDAIFSYPVESEDRDSFWDFFGGERYEGYAIRPVYEHVNVENVLLDKDRIEIITAGESINLCATVLPGNATNKSVTWTSSDESIAVVSQAGQVTGVSNGRAVITVTTQEGGFEASCEVVVGIVPITEFYFDSPETGLFVGDTRTLHPIIVPDDATYQALSWSSSNPSVASVSSSGQVTGISVGSAVITATTLYGGKSASCHVTVFQRPQIDESLESVDMGLSVKWASHNLGATKPEECGNYYAWGEVETKAKYSWGTYKWCMGSQYTFTKYCSRSDIGYNGFVDGKKELDDADDAAYVLLGGKWRMPRISELVELVENCNVIWQSRNGVDGYYFVSKITNNMIFLPITGHANDSYIANSYFEGSYSSRSSNGEVGSYYLSMASDHITSWAVISRYYGLVIRPVYGDGATPVERVTLDKTNLVLAVGETQSLAVTVLPDNATNKAVSWSSSNPSVATVSSSGDVKGVTAGACTITVTSQDGEKTASCYVSVKSSGSSNLIYYTSSDGTVVTPYSTDVFGANIISNTYSDNQGIIQFDGPVTMVGDLAFYGCSNLESITIPEGCSTIGQLAFNSNYSLLYINLPSSLTKIRMGAFFACQLLKSVILPEGLKEIGEYAFYGCASLREITIPQSITGGLYAVFGDCNGLVRFSGKYADPSGRALIDGETLMAVASYGLTSYEVPDYITNISASVFLGDYLIESITLPDKLKSIGESAFEGCRALTGIILPESVNSIGARAFYNCYSLSSITTRPTIPPSGAKDMLSSTGDCPIYVPAASINAYKTAGYWSDYADRIFPIESKQKSPAQIQQK